jgi:TRAP transporter TAXI family solute receptor
MKRTLYLCWIVSILYSGNIFAQNSHKIIKIGTGNKNALAYPVVSAICDIFNKNTLNKTISCKAIETGGSEDNLDGIISGKFDMGVIKADMQYNAYNGVGIFNGKSYRDLRTVFGLHNEFLTMIVKNNSEINNFGDFINKRVYVGNKGSGSRILVDKLFKEIGWTNQDFKEIHEDQADKIYDLFCQNKIDAAIYLVGHPNEIFAKTLKECNIKLISFSRKEIEDYIDFFPHIFTGVITKNTYKNQNNDIHTFVSQLLLASSSKVDEKIIYDFVQVIFEHQEELKSKISILKETSLLGSQTNVIPFHNGAVRYYKTLN